ncbi:MAG TPA: response regulator [Flavisolibacter sp.]|nr:response regulator [Flavisolibacter sp.]
MLTPVKKRVVLYADDDADDKAWVIEACKALNCSLEMEFVGNGKEVLGYLSPLSKKEELPSLIVLDLNMPKLDGRQTLQRLKSNPTYKNIPVAIVTTSSNKMDQDVCKKLGADLFLIKPDKQVEWENIIRQLEPFAA